MADQDVTPSESSPDVAQEAAAAAAGSSQGDVTPVQGEDRPVTNAVAEFNRKFQRLENQIQSMAQMVAMQQQYGSQPQTQKAPPTDEELWSLAQQGDRPAFELYMERIADRKGRAQIQDMQYTNLVDSQLGTLAQRYPVFNDPNHPLTQTVNSAYNIMVQRGYPANKATLLDAMKTAIADRPDLVSELHQTTRHAQDATRISASRRAQAGQTGMSSREGTPETRQGNVRQLTQAQRDLANRMGVKDPEKAMQRFQKRQDSGQSAFGAVGSALPEDSL